MDDIKKILSSAKKKLISAGVPEGRDAEFILEYVLGKKLTDYSRQNITVEQMSEYNSLIERRLNREPLDSIFNSTEFLGLTILFSKDTLTPRQETEIMTDAIVRENTEEGLRVLDLCTGSGCIGLALKKHLKNASVVLSDISNLALNMAKYNAQINNIDVEYKQSDLFENINGKYDIIVSNPPYIPSVDLDMLEKEVKDYDPILALDGGPDGLDFYRKIAERINEFLAENGKVYIEFGINQTEQITNLFKDKLKDIEIIKDYSGIDRYLKGKK